MARAPFTKIALRVCYCCTAIATCVLAGCSWQPWLQYWYMESWVVGGCAQVELMKQHCLCSATNFLLVDCRRLAAGLWCTGLSWAVPWWLC